MRSLTKCCIILTFVELLGCDNTSPNANSAPTVAAPPAALNGRSDGTSGRNSAISEVRPSDSRSGRPDLSVVALDGTDSSFTLLNRPSSDQRLSVRLERGISLFRSKKFAAAVPEFKAIIVADPKNTWAHYYLGTTYLELGSPKRAIPYFENALRLTPSHVESRIGRGIALLRDERFVTARNDFDEVISEGNGTATIYQLRAQCHFMLGEFEPACDDASRALETEPDLADAHFIRCLARARLDLTDDALRDYQRAVNLGLDEKLAAVARSFLKPERLKENSNENSSTDRE